MTDVLEEVNEYIPIYRTAREQMAASGTPGGGVAQGGDRRGGVASRGGEGVANFETCSRPGISDGHLKEASRAPTNVRRGYMMENKTSSFIGNSAQHWQIRAENVNQRYAVPARDVGVKIL